MDLDPITDPYFFFNLPEVKKMFVSTNAKLLKKMVVLKEQFDITNNLMKFLQQKV